MVILALLLPPVAFDPLSHFQRTASGANSDVIQIEVFLNSNESACAD